MDILIGIVIAVFIITAVYVGYYASQAPEPEGEAHSIPAESNFESLDTSQILKIRADQISVL
ncbi:hypothetical protein NsoK4_04320 [Nitrosopumilus sp. K4]|uniref:hypothetical protein n=1 Tax=Nitrosopumilus sp. K4 TaxID=2795383 RepID=UPI001BACE2E8|nr:hypothetical protein [Nitrosopumilus sp. K4]QUC65474.1 hypothetical protein NsoK4_04320 [Nitrosopumilus sp. K4]